MIYVRFKSKYMLLMLVDIVTIFVGFAFGFVTWNHDIAEFRGALPQLSPASNLPVICAIVAGYIIVFILFDMYKISLRQITFADLFTIITADVMGFILSLIIYYFFGGILGRASYLHLTTLIISSIVIFLGVTFVRCVPRAITIFRYRIQYKTASGKTMENVMIYGAGQAGNTLYREFEHNPVLGSRVCCYYDDDPQKDGNRLNGIKIYGPSSSLERIVKDYNIHTIVLAIPSASPADKTEILNKCKYLGCKLKTLPLLYDLVLEDTDLYRNIRSIDVNDLLGREETHINVESVDGYIRDMNVMVTGAGGSIGSELCRQIAAFRPKKLILFDIYENNMYDLISELTINLHLDQELKIVSYIGSVRDFDRVNTVCNKEKPDVIFHAAAHKHVPFMEDAPGEAIKNNVFGTFNVAKAADENHVKTFVLISTDKAVNPTNVMGTTKRLAELVIQAYAKKSKTRFTAVRFGNVLGSNGSVVPLFKRQIENGGPVTVTHPEITRFFMTIPEAARLVIQAGSIANGGEIFVLDMGKPVKILDLAKDMIRISGYTPDVDMKIEFTGLRPGEKLYEELLQDEEGTTKTSYNGIFIGSPSAIEWDELDAMLADLRKALDTFSTEEIISALQRNVPTYHPERNMDKKSYNSEEVN